MSGAPGIDFATLFARAPNPYVVLDRDLTLTWMNDAYLAATMRRREDIVGRRMFDAFPSDPASDSRRLLDRSLRRVLDSGDPDEIALIRYDIVKPDGAMEVRYWSATHTPLHDAAGAVVYILQHTVDVTELHDLRRLRDSMGVVQRADAVQARNSDLAAETDRLKSVLEQAPGFVAVLSGPDHVFQMANAAYHRLVANRQVVGQPVAQALPEVVEQGFVKLLDTVRAEGKSFIGERQELFLRKENSDDVEQRYLTFIYQPIFDDGAVSGIFVQGHDVTEEVAASERQALLINELNHRVKNTLAIVQALATQSFRRVEGADAALGSFDARLNALAGAHSLLTARNWQPAPIGDTLRTAVTATVGAEVARCTFAGPEVTLSPQAGVSLAMIAHELSTNALKYGALSSAAGRIDIDWRFADEAEQRDRIILQWRESGGPPVVPPTRRGFGTRLIERGLSADGGHVVALDFQTEGLVCTLTLGLEAQA